MSDEEDRLRVFSQICREPHAWHSSGASRRQRPPKGSLNKKKPAVRRQAAGRLEDAVAAPDKIARIMPRANPRAARVAAKFSRLTVSSFFSDISTRCFDWPLSFKPMRTLLGAVVAREKAQAVKNMVMQASRPGTEDRGLAAEEARGARKLGASSPRA